MKKIILTFFFIYSFAYSQETISQFNILDRQLSVKAVKPDEKGAYDLYIDGYSLDASHEKVGLLVRYKKIEKFKVSLQNAAKKYEEWYLVAKENQVKELDKSIEASQPRVEGYFLYYDEWKFDFSVNLTYRMKISENNGTVDYAFIITTGELTASENQFMTLDNIAFVFYSVDEINDFISLLDRQLVLDKFNSKDNKEDLFKD